jgi:hypothetical protein
MRMFSKSSKLKQKLEKAIEREKLAAAALAKKHLGGEWEEYNAASKEVLMLEREIAAENNEEYAVRIDFPVQWDTGAPLPHLFINDYCAYLSFYIYEPDPKWDGTYVNVVNPSDKAPASLALVEFKSCSIAKLGAPNDEAFYGHPLEGKGLEGYAPLVVKNSKWLEEIKSINKVHEYYKEEHWLNRNHYLFGFHDSTFECIADSFEVSLYNTNMASLMEIICKKMLE